ncbi:MAG: DnaB-like helicase N-terminal domain-containing protein, partial [Mariprofundaceae bacterium]
MTQPTPLPRTNSLRERIPPHAYDAECAVIGGIMLDPEALERLEGSLLAEHFYIEANGIIFATILELSSRHQPVDALTVKDHLEQIKTLDAIGGEAYLSDLVASIPTAANVQHYASKVRERAVLRKLLSACGQISQEVYEEAGREIGEHLDKAERLVLEVAESFSRSRPTFHNMKDLMIDAYKAIEKRYEDKKSITGIPTGFDDLDELTSGMQRSDLIIVAGRPS